MDIVCAENILESMLVGKSSCLLSDSEGRRSDELHNDILRTHVRAAVSGRTSIRTKGTGTQEDDLSQSSPHSYMRLLLRS